MKRPAFQFYPADWRKDAALQSCSLAARGAWIDLLCIMHECEPYGALVINDKPMGTAQIARLLGESADDMQRILDELDAAGVFGRREDGAVYSRRMVRDEDIRARRAAGGEGGKEFGKLGAKYGSKGGRPRIERGDKKPPLKPPPSSSSSSSSSEQKQKTAPSAEWFDGIPDQVVADFKALRAKLRAPITATAMDGIKREAAKAGVSLADALRMCCERGWRGFKAEWLQDRHAAAVPITAGTPRRRQELGA